MKKYVEFKHAKPFLDWLTLQPREINKHVEFELSFTDIQNKNPTLVCFFLKDDGLDTYALYRAFIKDTGPIED